MHENETLQYYEENAADFISATQNVNMSQIQNAFLSLLPKKAVILDLGCGSGRDSLAFLQRGFIVDAVDACTEFCKATAKLTAEFSNSGKIKIHNFKFTELSETQKYDGVWACSSLLHVPKLELSALFAKIKTSLKPNGIFYCSFKRGNFEGMRNGRYFSDFSEDELCTLIENAGGFHKIKIWQTHDVRAVRNDIWINSLWRV